MHPQFPRETQEYKANQPLGLQPVPDGQLVCFSGGAIVLFNGVGTKTLAEHFGYASALFPIKRGGRPHVWVGSAVNEFEVFDPDQGVRSGGYSKRLSEAHGIKDQAHILDLAVAGDELLVIALEGLASIRHGEADLSVEKVPLEGWPGRVDRASLFVRGNGEVIATASWSPSGSRKTLSGGVKLRRSSSSGS
jgi:hypothetical protein